jgi:sulfur carrier protein
MQVTVNGDQHEVASNTNLQQLLQQLAISNGRIAIEINGEIVPKSLFSEQTLNSGDKIEIVRAIGGG